LSAFLIVAFCFLSISTHTLVRLLKPRLEQHNVFFFFESAANGTFSGLLLFNVAPFRALCLGILLMFFWVLRRRFYQDFAQLIWGDLLIDKFTQPNKSHNYEASLEISSKSRFFNSSSSLLFRMSLWVSNIFTTHYMNFPSIPMSGTFSLMEMPLDIWFCILFAWFLVTLKLYNG